MDVRGGEDALAVLVPEGEPSVPPSVLLQDLDHLTKRERKVRVGRLLGYIAEDHCVCVRVCVYSIVVRVITAAGSPSQGVI